MRTPMQIEGVERGPERQAQIGNTGTVNPAFLGGLGDIAKDALPHVANAAKGAISGVMNG